MLENRLPALFDSAKGGAEVPTEVFRRLQFLARVLRNSPVAGSPGVRLLWQEEGGAVATATIGGEPFVIGRESGCNLVLASPRVSRRHCQLRLPVPNAPVVEIEDLGSSNGTLVNGLRLPERGRRALRDGDVIEVGGIPLAVAVMPSQ